MMAVVYDSDDFSKPSGSLQDANYIGETHFEMHQLMSSIGKRKEFELKEQGGSRPRGNLVLEFEEIQSESNSVLDLGLTIKEPSNLDTGSSYFYVVSKNTMKRDREGRVLWAPVLRSEILKYSNSQTDWVDVELPLAGLVQPNTDLMQN